MTTALIASLKDNLFSQWGEEAMIVKLLNLLKDSGRTTLVEFGGSRGTDNSNFLRFSTDGYQVVMIEGDPSRFEELQQNLSNFRNATAINAYVGTTRDINSLDTILDSRGIECNSVVGVSIDVDGDDALLLENLTLAPDFVIVEHNPLLPIEGFFRNPAGEAIGNNLGELCRVGASLGYFPAGLTESNLILVKNYLRQEVAAINLLDATNSLNLPKFGLGYNGTLVRFSSMNDTTEEIMDAGWSRSLIVQPVPKFLRGFGENGKLSRFKPILRRILALSFVVIVKPISLVKLLMRRS